MKWNEQRYHSLAYELKTTYRRQLYRLSLDGGMWCPNRTDTSSGCIFCSASGSGDYTPSPYQSMDAQFLAARARLGAKDPGPPYIAYFQAYSNTYAPLDKLKELYDSVIHRPDVAILSIATRPDCLSPEIIDYLGELNQIKPVWIELGLQTIHEKTHLFLQTEFKMKPFLHVLSELNHHQITVIAHVILGLPFETYYDNMETMDFIAAHPIQGVKIHMLYIQQHTELANYYRQHPFSLFTQEEYTTCVCDCLEHLRPDQVIHRLTGDCDRNELVAPIWTLSKRQTLNQIHQILTIRDSFQGKNRKVIKNDN